MNMSGYSPIWTHKGSDKLRALQITKILMNSLKRIISSFDLSKKDTKEVIIYAIAETIHRYFTPNQELGIEEQIELFIELLGWKTLTINKNEEKAEVKLGANRFFVSESKDPIYLVIVSGIMKAVGYLLFNTDVEVEQIPSRFESQQLQVDITKTSKDIPAAKEHLIEAEWNVSTPITPTQTSSEKIADSIDSKEKDEVEIKSTIEVELHAIFSPILKEYPTQTLFPIFHKVLSEITSTFFSEIEDANIKKAKTESAENNILFLIEFILINTRDSGQDLHEIAGMIGQYVTKALLSKSDDNLIEFLPDEITSTISRRVVYVDFPARNYCTYAPGEKCVEEKRDLCDFVMYIWEGMLQVLLPDKNFKLGERIPATRRGKFCLVEFLKNE